MNKAITLSARWACGLLLLGASCAHEAPAPAPAPAAPTAAVAGVRVFVDEKPQVTVTSSECQQGAPELVKALPSALRAAAEKALTERGFSVAQGAGAPHDLLAHVDATLSYCNASSKIVNGSVGLALENGGQILGRASADGDLSNPPNDLFAQMVDTLAHASGVIAYGSTHKQPDAH